ncbi:MAG: spermidine/putrescine ABC transporter substrate-binding protein [Caldilinea sp. CFX5]|nr:spermidine/putrescine ABC transporter substrate-binding protein [Caldilinea sp. CFX5]
MTKQLAKLRSPAMAALLILSLLVAACGGGSEESSATGDSTGDTPIAEGFTCPEPAPRMEVTSTEVNLFVWTEYIPQEAIDCFEEVYNIQVNKDEYSTNEEMYAKLSAGGANYDLVQPTDYIVALMIRQNLLQKLDKSKLPVLEGFDPNYLDQPFDPGNEYTIPYQAGTDAIVVNTDVITELPKSWADLWNPAYEGRMVSIDDSRAIIGLTLLTLGYDLNSTDPAQLEEAKTKLAELMPNIKLFDSDSPKTALIGGDVDLGIVWTGEAFLAQQENPAIQFIYPSEGAIVWQDNYAIPVDAPHLDAAYALLNYSLQPDLFWLDINGESTTLGALYETYINSNITNTPPEALAAGHRIEDVGDALPLYDQIWTEVKGE